MKNPFKKVATILTIIVLVLMSILASACNQNIFDGFKLVINYALVKEGDQYVLHKVSSWNDSESDSMTISTSCCGNYLLTSLNSSTFYEDYPTNLGSNVIVCKGV